MEIENNEHIEEVSTTGTSESESLISFNESDKGFDASLMIKQDLIQRIKNKELKLNKSNVFNMPSVISRMLKRKNEIFYFVNTCEMHVDIKDTSGHVYLPLLTKAEISEKLRKIDPEVRSKMSMVHLGAIKILLKAEFRAGIDSPVRMALIDNRINNRQDSILGAARGNLAYQKFMFTVYPKFALSLNSKDLDQVLSFVHEFERTDLMNKGNKVFSITYLIGYALSNSHHSVDYKHKENIELEDVFSEVGSIENNRFADTSPMDNSWAINIAKNKTIIGSKPPPQIRGDTLYIGEPSRRSVSQNELSTRDILLSISKRVDDYGHQLKQMS